jgi:DnaJ-domain-containing protein 1
MILLLLGALAVAVLLFLRLFAGADPKILARSLRYSAAVTLAVLAILFAATERFPIAAVAGTIAWVLFSGWRFKPRKTGTANRTGGAMSRSEALEVLGLREGATSNDIRAAHRRLIVQNHPDHGGSDYLASKINEAKDVLLG